MQTNDANFWNGDALDLEEVAADAARLEVPSDQGTKMISDLANLLQSLEATQRRKLDELEYLQDSIKEIRTRKLPDALQLAGVKQLQLEDGSWVGSDLQHYANISEERAPAAFEWLEANGHGAVIKSEVITSFGKGENEAALAFQQELADKNLKFKAKRNVHPSTLKAFVARQLESEAKDTTGEFPKLPKDVFGVYSERVASIRKQRQ